MRDEVMVANASTQWTTLRADADTEGFRNRRCG